MNGLIPLYLSPSKVFTYESCPRQYYYKYVLKWKGIGEPASLLWGSAAHFGIETFQIGQAQGKYVSAAETFSTRWTSTVAGREVTYTDRWDVQSLDKCGRGGLNLYEAKWDEAGYQVCVDPQGKPLVEIPLIMALGQNNFLRLKIDDLHTTPAGDVEIGETKTAKNDSPVEIAYVMDQTVAQQVAVETFGKVLGVDRIDSVRFMKIFKTKKEPKVSFDSVAPRRDATQVKEYLDKVRHVAADIRAMRFWRKAGMPHSTPCTMCDFYSHCVHNTFDGIDSESVKISISKAGRDALGGMSTKAIPAIVKAA